MDHYRISPGFNRLNQIISILILSQISTLCTMNVSGTTLGPLEFDESQVIKVKNGTTIKLVCNFGNIHNLAKQESHHKLSLNENILWIKVF